jgi:phospholipase/carboxylesterase
MGESGYPRAKDMPLQFELSAPENVHDGAPVIVLLHGRGSDRFNLTPIGRGLAPDAVVVTPQAPFPAEPWGYGPGWAWYRYLGEDRPEPETFDESQRLLSELLAGLPTRLPMAPGPTVLGGFSQGATMSLAHALLYPGTISHVLNFSGFLAAHPRVNVTPESVGDVEIFWGHGTHDPAIPFPMAESGRRKLERAGARLTARDYRMGHRIDPQELADAGRWLMDALDRTPPVGDGGS